MKKLNNIENSASPLPCIKRKYVFLKGKLTFEFNIKKNFRLFLNNSEVKKYRPLHLPLSHTPNTNLNPFGSNPATYHCSTIMYKRFIEVHFTTNIIHKLTSFICSVASVILVSSFVQLQRAIL